MKSIGKITIRTQAIIFVLVVFGIARTAMTDEFTKTIRCTNDEEHFFLGQTSEPDLDYPSPNHPHYCKNRNPFGEYWRFISGTDMGTSIYNKDFGIWHFYMGDTWDNIGGGDLIDQCSDDVFGCSEKVTRHDVVGWVDEDTINDPDENGIEIKMKSRTCPSGIECLNGLGIQGIHSDLEGKSNLSVYWRGVKPFDWPYTVPGGAAYVREEHSGDPNKGACEIDRRIFPYM